MEPMTCLTGSSSFPITNRSGLAFGVRAVLLFQRFHSATPVAVYVIGCCLVSLVAGALLRERSRQDLSVEYDEPAPQTSVR